MNTYMSEIVDLGYVSSVWEKPDNPAWKEFYLTGGRSDFSAMGI